QIQYARKIRPPRREGIARKIREFLGPGDVLRFEYEFARRQYFPVGGNSQNPKNLFPSGSQSDVIRPGGKNLNLALRRDSQDRVRFLQAEPGDVISKIIEAVVSHRGRGQNE